MKEVVGAAVDDTTSGGPGRSGRCADEFRFVKSELKANDSDTVTTLLKNAQPSKHLSAFQAQGGSVCSFIDWYGVG